MEERFDNTEYNTVPEENGGEPSEAVVNALPQEVLVPAKKKNSFRNGFFLGFGVMFVVGVCLFFCFLLLTGQLIIEKKGDSAANKVTTAKIKLLEKTIHDFYMEDVETETLENGIYKGMLNSLKDVYSVYYTPEELEEMTQDTEGIYYGIGAYISIDPVTAFPMLSGIIDGTPAQEVGLRAGDIIYMVEGEIVQGWELSDVVSHVKGPEGTTVHLTIARENETDYLQFDVPRRKVESPTVSGTMMEDGIGYIQITEFDDVTYGQFVEEMKLLREEGMEGLIIDLRGNPGGNLSTVCDICREILPEGLIVYTEDKYGKRSEYTCDGSKEIQEKLVVLINGGSASASEILSGAVKDYGIGTLVGTTTFGKGIVQRIIPFSDGSAVKLTVSSYFTPAGNNIHKKGIEPDVAVEFDADAYYDDGIDVQLDKALEILREQLGR